MNNEECSVEHECKFACSLMVGVVVDKRRFPNMKNDNQTRLS